MNRQRPRLAAAAKRSLVMSNNAYVIETARHTAGIAVREPRGFRFYASDALFQPLDNLSFGGLRDLWAAIDLIVEPRHETSGDHP
jgi:hypothetical protein